MYAQLSRKDSGGFVALSEDGQEYKIPYIPEDRLNAVKNDIDRRGDNAIYLIEPITSRGKKPEAKLKAVVEINPVSISELDAIRYIWNQEATFDDPKLFVRTQAAEQIENGNKIFLVGRKGTGKSAIAHNLLKSSKYIGESFSFENFPFEKLYKFQAHEFSHSKYKPIWEIIYLTLAIGLLHKSSLTPSDVKAKIEDHFEKKNGTNEITSKISGFFKKVTNSHAGKLMGIAASVVTTIDPVNVTSIILDKLFGDGQKSSASFDNEMATALSELKIFIKSLGSFPPVLVVFDQLDEEYTARGTLQVADTYADIIRSLFSASIEISRAKLGIQPLVLLREDIFNSFESANKAKFMDFMITLNWSKEELKSVISQRLNRTFGHPEQYRFERMWLELFTPFFSDAVEFEVKNEDSGETKICTRNRYHVSSYEAFMRHTSRTPRDCVKLLICITEQMVLRKKRLCDAGIFASARPAMGEYYKQQVIDAVEKRERRIREIFRVFAENIQGTSIGKIKLKEILDKNFTDIPIDIDNLLNMLYDVSAIGVLGEQNKKYRAKYTCNAEYRLKKGETLAFHPVLAVSLGLDISVAGASYQNEYDNDDAAELDVQSPSDESINNPDSDSMHTSENKILQLPQTTEPILISTDHINDPLLIDTYLNQIADKTWVMECEKVNDTRAVLTHKKFSGRIYLIFDDHGITNPPQIGDRFVGKIGIGLNEQTGKNWFVVKSYEQVE